MSLNDADIMLQKRSRKMGRRDFASTLYQT